MKEELIKLIELQQAETEVNIIKLEIEKAPEKIEVIDKKLEEAYSLLGDQENFVAENNKKYRSLEADSKSLIEDISKRRPRLDMAKTNKEYKSTIKEIDDLNAKKSEIEDEMLALIDNIESAEKLLSEKKEELKRLSEDYGKKRKSIKKKAEQDKNKLDVINVRLYEMYEKLDSNVLAAYLKIRDIFVPSPAAVPVEDSVCRGCNVNIPPQLYNEIQRCDKITFCPNCQRIIYWKKLEEGQSGTDGRYENT